jgi:glycosyltransferase involved in cell wall biosynthesis
MAVDKENVALVIPLYNEGDKIRELLDEISRYFPLKNVVLVDDGSTPPVSRAQVAPARVLRHRVNLGKGMALKTGCEFALRRRPEAIVLMDGDGQHDPKELPALLETLDGTEVVFTARRHGSRMPWVRLLGNQVINLGTELLFGLDLHDVWCGYRAFRSEVYARIAWNAADYAADVEMALRAARQRLDYREIRIGTIYHDAYKGVTVLDGLKLLLRLVVWKFTLAGDEELGHARQARL